MSRRRATEPTGRLVPYCRQSLGRRGETRETSLSIEAQAAVIADWAQNRGYVVAPPVIDHDELGSDPDRPGIAELLARTAPGDTVGVHMWDRLARGILLQESIVKRLAGRGVTVVSITQNSDPLGRQIYGVMGEEYSRQLGRRLEAVWDRRAERGHHHGQPPFGWRRAKLTEHEADDGTITIHRTGDLEPDPDEAPIVERLFALRAAGQSYADLARWAVANAPPGRLDLTNRKNLKRLLTNPVHAGAVRHNGEILWTARHTGIIGRATWDRVQSTFLQSEPRAKAVTHWLEGLIVHRCGAPMYLQTFVWRSGARSTTYQYVCANAKRTALSGPCRPPHVSVGMIKADRLARQALAADLAAAIPWRDAMRHLKAAARSEETVARRRELQRALERIDHQRDRARALWLAGSDSVETWDRDRADFDRQRAAILADLATLPDDISTDELRLAATGIRDAATAIRHADDPTLRELLTALGVVTITPTGLQIRYHRPYAAIIPTPITLPLSRP